MKIFRNFLPKEELTFLVSGGVDSIAACHWLKTRYRQKLNILHFNHKCQPANELMASTVESFASALGVDFRLIVRNTDDQQDCSENGLRQFRLDHLAKIGGRYITAHHLGDCCENYLSLCFQGKPEYKPIQEKTKFSNFVIYHPFLLNTKEELIEYAKENDLMKYVVEDPTNKDTSMHRNWIRNIIIPEIQTRSNINLQSVIKKKFYSLTSFKNDI